MSVKVTCAVKDCIRTGVRDVILSTWTPAGNVDVEVAMCNVHSMHHPGDPEPEPTKIDRPDRAWGA